MLSFRKDIMMYDIEYYFDKNGYSAISDYFADLAKKSIYSKTVRIQKNKIFAYIKALKEYGTRIGNPIVKHYQGKENQGSKNTFSANLAVEHNRQYC